VSWICCEGLDATGKSTVAEYYKKQGYEVIHMSAPDKKYTSSTYAGPTYFEDMVDLYMKYLGKKVFWDRSQYGEQIWAKVYNRKPMLTENEIDELREIELDNNTEYILMVDEDLEAHWKRCQDNNEPLTKYQFTKAHNLYGELAIKYDFTKKQLSEYQQIQESTGSKSSLEHEDISDKKSMDKGSKERVAGVRESFEQLKLRKANIINDVLSKRIIKKNGEMYQELENDIRDFLNNKLSDLFGESKKEDFTKEDMTILKEYCNVIKQKQQRRR